MATHVHKNDVFKVLKLVIDLRNMAMKGYNILSECQRDAPEIISETLKRKQQEFENQSRKKSKIGVNTDDFTLVQEILESSGEFENDFNRLEELTSYELKQMCKDYGLSQNGHKLDLVQRIADYLHDQRGFNTRISSFNNSNRESIKRAEYGESAVLKEDEVSLLNKLMEEEGKVNDEVFEERINKNEMMIEEHPQKHIQSPSPISRPVHKAIPVLKNQDLLIESPIIEKPLKSIKPKLDMEEIESNIEETVDECELKRKIKLEMEKRKASDNKFKEANTPKTYNNTISKTPRTPKPNLKATIKHVNPIISKLKNSVVTAKPSPINSSQKQQQSNTSNVTNNNSITKPAQLIHPISTPILNHKCSKVFVNNNIQLLLQENKKKENANNKKTNNDENSHNHSHNSNNNENKENKEDNSVKKNTTDSTDKKKCNNNKDNKSNQDDWTSGEQLQKQLKYQYDHYLDLECIFGTVKMCKLDTIFPNCQETVRGSSGDWRNDGLTKEEREEYKREIELERLL